MTNVISITSRKNSEAQKKKQDNKALLLSAVDDVWTQWEYHQKRGTINDHIAKTCKVKKKDFINDLNAVSSVEQKLGISASIFGPGCLASVVTGYAAGFKMGDDNYSTPEMISEAQARAFNLLLYLAIRQATN